MIGTFYYLTRDSLDAVCCPSADDRLPSRQRHFHIRIGQTDAAPTTDGLVETWRQQLQHTVLNKRQAASDEAAIMDWITERAALPESSFLCIHDGTDSGVIRRFPETDTHYRRIQARAAHNLPLVSADHRCHRLHGHDYQLTLYAATERNGLAATAAALRQQLDQSYLNEIPGLDNPTCEMLALWIWEHCRSRAIDLTGIAVQETLSSGCYYDGNFHIWRDMRFESAWRTATEEQTRTRGGRLLLRVYATLPLCGEKGWTMDFAQIKQCLAPLHEEMDHHMLSDIPALADDTESRLFPWLCDRMATLLPATTRIELRQDPTTGRLMTGGLAAPPIPL